jgi:2-phospho-L-lactate guanylyltransferase
LSAAKVRQMKTAAILPVKRFEQAKQRLRDELGQDARTALARAMLGDVLLALESAGSIESVIVVTSEPSVETTSATPKVVLMEDTAEAGQSRAAIAGLEKAAALGFRQALLVPGDCPLMDPAELDRLIQRTASSDLQAVIVPDRHREGTNALLMDLPTRFEPEFGPGSLARHEKQAARLGLRHLVESVESLALDVDTPDDLVALVVALENKPFAAARSRAAIRAVLPAGRRRPIPAG